MVEIGCPGASTTACGWLATGTEGLEETGCGTTGCGAFTTAVSALARGAASASAGENSMGRVAGSTEGLGVTVLALLPN